MDSSIINNGITVITPKEGYLLTLKYLDNEDERIYTDMLYLGINDSINNWQEVLAEINN